MTGLAKAGEVVIKKINLVRASGEFKLDLTGMFTEVNIYEDIFSPVLTGKILLVESFNLQHAFPLLGEELLEIEFITPTFSEEMSIKKLFYIYKIGESTLVGDKKNVYILHFISPEGVADLNIKLSRAFVGTPDLIVKQIFDKYLKNGLQETPIEVERSNNQLKFVAPMWAPVKCINHITSRAQNVDSYGSPDYLFFETTKGFKFASLGTLYTQPASHKFFNDAYGMRLTSTEGSTRDISREFSTFTDFEVTTSVDYIDRIMRGVYSNKVIEVDLLHKTVGSKNYDIFKDFDKTKHLDQYPMHSEYIEQPPNGERIDWKVVYPYVHDTMTRDRGAELLCKRIALLSQTEMYKINVSIPGHTLFACGQVADFDMHDSSTVEEEDISKKKLNQYYSGRYLITAVRHRFTKSQHRVECQMIKDSFKSPVTFKSEI